MKRRDGIYLIIIAALIGALLAPVVGAQVGGDDLSPGTYNLSEGNYVFQAECASTDNDYSADPLYWDVDVHDCVTPDPTATTAPPTATATSTAVPSTATPTPPIHEYEEFGVCGEWNDRWHPPVINQAYVDRWGVGTVGCATGHEHGDNPDNYPWLIDWLIANEGRDYVSFNHSANTPGENVHKHNAFYLQYGDIQGVEFMHLRHGQTNPHGRCGGAYFGAFHSEVTYALDPGGNVTRVGGWQDFGRCNNENRRPGLNDPRPANVGHMIVPRPGETTCESWYNGHHPILMNGGRFICNASAYYMGFSDEREYSGKDDVANWNLTGGVGNHRSWDANWYEDQLGFLRGETFYTDQFGEWLPGGLDDPRCGATETVMGVPTVVLCIEQVISPTWQSIEFPGNYYDNGSYPAGGVVQPNH